MSCEPKKLLEHAAVVEVETSIKKKKKKVSGEGSIIHSPLIPADPLRIMLAVLHILLGIKMSLWVLLIDSIQSVDRKTYVSKVYTEQILGRLKIALSNLDVANEITKNSKRKKTAAIMSTSKHSIVTIKITTTLMISNSNF